MNVSQENTEQIEKNVINLTIKLGVLAFIFY